MIVVIDSGIWVSAFQFGGTPLAALELAFSRDIIACCDQIIEEVHVTLARKFSWHELEVREIMNQYLSAAALVATSGRLNGVCRDPKDDMVFECAVESQAGIIVSGDRDIISVGKYQGIFTLTAREYLDHSTISNI